MNGPLSLKRLERIVCGRLVYAGIVFAQPSAEAADIELKAVRKNPACVGGESAGAFCSWDHDCDSLACSGDILPTTNISARPGDVIVAEAVVSNWSPNGESLRAFQWTVQGSGFSSGFRGTVQPFGFTAHKQDEFDGAFFRELNGVVCWVEEYLFHWPEPQPCLDFRAVDRDGINYIFMAAETVADGPRRYLGVEKYIGTLVLEVLPDACGQFAIRLAEPPDTVLETTTAGLLPIELTPLTITVGTVCSRCRRDATGQCLTWPADCSIDARQPSEPDGSAPAGINSVDLAFDIADPTDIRPDLFAVRTVPADLNLTPALPGRPYVADVELISEERVRIHLSDPIPPGHWTCIDYTPDPASEVCIGSLPADADNNGVSEPADLQALLGCLTGSAVCTPLQCDIDRSGTCTPADLLRLVDLLNGADAFVPWNGAGIGIGCPSE